MAKSVKRIGSILILAFIFLSMTAAYYPMPLPGTSGNILTSNGTKWTSSAPATVPLTTGVSGVLPIANGGTNNGSLAVTAGGIVYTDGSKLMNTGANTANQAVMWNGSSAPTAYALISNSYSFTPVNGTNAAASTFQVGYYMRVGPIVRVQGLLNLDPTTAGTQTIVGVPLPVSSDLTGATNLEGFCNDDDLNGRCRVYANTANDRAEIDITPTGASNAGLHFTFMYVVQ